MSSVQQQPNLSKPPVVTSPVIDKAAKKRELLAKVKVLRNNLASGTFVQGSPDKVYTWVNIREERQIFFQAMGWQLCKDPEIKCNYKPLSDGTYKRADLILYEIDKDLYDAIQADRELRSMEAIESVEEGFAASTARQGVPTFKPRV